LPAFDGEHHVDVNLRAGVGHEPKLSLPMELENLFFDSAKTPRLRRSRGNFLNSA
jgi:hypothetical protein